MTMTAAQETLARGLEFFSNLFTVADLAFWRGPELIVDATELVDEHGALCPVDITELEIERVQGDLYQISTEQCGGWIVQVVRLPHSTQVLESLSLISFAEIMK